MKLYLAGPWAHREAVRTAAQQFVKAGHVVTTDWFDQPETQDPRALQHQAAQDWKNLLRAEVLVLLDLALSEGKAVEQGIALQRHLPIIAIGTPGQNVFHYLKRYLWVDSIEAAIALLQHMSDVHYERAHTRPGTRTVHPRR